MGALPPPLRIEPRWTDLDPVGHVNNSVYLVYAEESRARLCRTALANTWSQVVVVHNGIDYHSPVEELDVVEVTSSVESVGRSSFATITAIDTETGRRCATVRTVQAVLADDRLSSRPWTTAERAALERLVIGSTQG